MAMEKDQSAWLPEPPPPRPARREAAIEAALRKFDGAEETAPSSRKGPLRAWTSTHRPQVAVLASAMLLVMVGIPAALIGLRNAPAPHASQSRPPVVVVHQSERIEPPQPAPAPTASIAQLPPSSPRSLSAPPLSKYNGTDLGVAAKNEPARSPASPTLQEETAPAAPMAAAAPPPPPPPAPQAGAQTDQFSREARAENIIVTGSRAERTALTSPSTEEAKAVADQGYPAFLSRLQAAVRANNHRSIIGLIGFPLRVNGAGGPRLYRDSASVERNFDRIFTSHVRKAILEQRGDQLFVRDQGAMVGRGEVWFSQTCTNTACSPPGPVRVIAVNP